MNHACEIVNRVNKTQNPSKSSRACNTDYYCNAIHNHSATDKDQQTSVICGNGRQSSTDVDISSLNSERRPAKKRSTRTSEDWQKSARNSDFGTYTSILPKKEELLRQLFQKERGLSALPKRKRGVYSS